MCIRDRRSAEAAKEIKVLITSSDQHVSSGVTLVGRSGESIDAILVKVDEIAGQLQEIAASAKEQAGGLSDVNRALNDMDRVTQQNTAMVEETTAASHRLNEQAIQLNQLIEKFDVGRAVRADHREIARRRA